MIYYKGFRIVLNEGHRLDKADRAQYGLDMLLYCMLTFFPKGTANAVQKKLFMLVLEFYEVLPEH